LTSAIGKCDGIAIDVGVEPTEPPLSPGNLGTLSVAETERPPTLPLTELTVGVIPPFPIQVMVAVPRPSGMLVRREISARTGAVSTDSSMTAEAIPIRTSRFLR
jgi:hypothetical protein